MTGSTSSTQTLRGCRRLLRAAPLALLGAENLAIFFRHYFLGYGFPWDFIGSYYAVVAYWTQGLSRGVLHDWMPFQSMGYPLRLHLQSGLWYPVLWLFPILKFPYTLHAAVILQGLHVFVGAIGMYVLLRTTIRSRREALVGAFAFQLFGGFYSQAQHVDVVRAFAFTPWLLAAVAPPRPSERAVPRRVVALSLAVWALAVGGYTGNLIAALFLLGVLAAAVLISARLRRRAWAWTGAVALAAALGLLMAAPHLGPAWMYRGELERHRVAETVQRASMTVADLPGLVTAIRGADGHTRLSSTFVGLLVVCGVCLLDRRALRGLAPFAVLLMAAATMAAGDSTPLHPALRRLLPPLAYSRFPSGDYRCVAAALLVVFAAAGWRAARRRRAPLQATLLRLLPAVAFALWAESRDATAARPAELAAVILGTGAAIAFFTDARKPRPIAVVALVAAAALDGARVLPRMDTWSVPDLAGVVHTYHPALARFQEDGARVSPAVFIPRRGSRPARTDELGYRASGYLTGAYDLGDYGGPVLRARERIVENPRALAYASREWLPLLVEPPEPAPSPEGVRLPGLEDRAARAAASDRVRQLSYGLDRIDYWIRLDAPALLVENEIFFPGWTGRIRERGRPERTLDALRVNGAWRAWRLPAGDYELEARFRLRGRRPLIAVAAVAWIAWTAWTVIALRRSLRDLIPLRV